MILHVVGMGPGREEYMTLEARQVLEEADVIVGYQVYLDELPTRLSHKRMLSTPMRQEKERCHMAFEEAFKGYRVCMLCSGDAGVYGMASLMYEIGVDYPQVELRIVSGVTAANSGGAQLGAPLGNDYCVISLSDLLTPLALIHRRLRAAADGDFSIAIYNPSSKKRKDYLCEACDILLESIPADRPCGLVSRIGREGMKVQILSLGELRNTQVDMFTTVFIGSSKTVQMGDHLVTRRGYHL